MENKKIVNQINALCKNMSFAPAISLVKCHKINERALTKQQAQDWFNVTEEFIQKMNRIRTDEYFGNDTGEDYLYLFHEAVFLGLLLEEENYTEHNAFKMYKRGITITI